MYWKCSLLSSQRILHFWKGSNAKWSHGDLVFYVKVPFSAVHLFIRFMPKFTEFFSWDFLKNSNIILLWFFFYTSYAFAFFSPFNNFHHYLFVCCSLHLNFFLFVACNCPLFSYVFTKSNLFAKAQRFFFALDERSIEDVKRTETNKSTIDTKNNSFLSS